MKIRIRYKALAWFIFFFIIMASNAHSGFFGTKVEEERTIFMEDFENGARGMPFGWSTFTDKDPSIASAWDNSVSHSLSKSMKIESTSANSEGRLECGYVILTKQSAPYSISYWIKSEDIISEDAGAFIQIDFYSKNGKQLGSYKGDYLQGASDWSQRDNSFITPKGTHRINISFQIKNSQGSVWLDDIIIKNIR